MMVLVQTNLIGRRATFKKKSYEIVGFNDHIAILMTLDPSAYGEISFVSLPNNEFRVVRVG